MTDAPINKHKAAWTPEKRAAHSRKVREAKALLSTPESRAKRAEQMRLKNADPAYTAKRRTNWLISAWCPDEYLSLYKALRREIGAKRAKPQILDIIEKDKRHAPMAA